jgi:hypothetical protein
VITTFAAGCRDAGVVVAAVGLAAPVGLGEAASSRSGSGTPGVVSVTVANLSATSRRTAGWRSVCGGAGHGVDNDVWESRLDRHTSQMTGISDRLRGR